MSRRLWFFFPICFLLATARLFCADTLIEGKGAFFYPTSSKFREIYSEGAMFGLETSVHTWDKFYTWASIGLFIKEGHSIGLHDPTRIAFYPFGLGIKYLYPVRWVDFYVGVGALGTYMHIHDHSSGVQQKICRWGGGGIVKAGTILNCTKHVFFDVFSDYSILYVPVAEHRDYQTRNANLSGWSIGAGLGYRFGCSSRIDGNAAR